MKILIFLSIGEVIDKISILTIKKKKINDIRKLIKVNKELNLLKNSLEQTCHNSFDREIRQLEKINLSLWQIEERLRVKENEKCFDDEFVALARSVYKMNDKRFEQKNKINQQYGSNISEVKSYV